MKAKAFFLVMVAGMLLSAAPDAEAKKGFYMGIGLAYNTIGGDFDGSSGLQGATEVIILPDIDNALGGNLLLGYGFNNAWAIELNWIVSGHNGTWGSVDGDVTYGSFSLNGKYNFRGSTAVQPYLLLGISGNELEIKEGAANTWTGQTGDAGLSGIGLNVAVGIENYITPNFSVNLGLMYRFVEYDEAESINESGAIDDPIDGSGASLLLSTVYHF